MHWSAFVFGEELEISSIEETGARMQITLKKSSFSRFSIDPPHPLFPHP
jgi:hypothetical protein